MQKDFLTVPFEVKNIQEDANNFIVEGYASFYGNEDLGGDVMMKGAFSKAAQSNQTIPVLWQHSMHEPIGASSRINEDQSGLFTVTILPKEDTFVSGRVRPQIRIGSIRELSVGYRVNKFHYKEINGRNLRFIEEAELIEYSFVTKAMNPKAVITGYKKADESVDVESLLSLKDAEKALKQFFSQKEAKTLISKIKEFSMQRDAEEREARRDVELKQRLLAEIKSLTNSIKNI